MYELDEIDWRILRILEKRRCLKRRIAGAILRREQA